MTQEKGKYYKKTRKSFGLGRTLILAIFIGLMFVSAVWFYRGYSDKSIYEQLCQNGYQGTQEQWIASLAGEVFVDGAESAYVLAKMQGYQGTADAWMETITGYRDSKPGIPAYRVAQEKGFDGNLEQWLASVADKPEDLGWSQNGANKTEYEIACEYGFSGTFIQWILSIASTAG